MKNNLDHERLDVYRVALEFVCLANESCERLPPGWAGLADQLRRAAISMPLNIAEGAGEFSRGEKLRFYRIARRSATECAAILDVCKRLRLLEKPNLREQRDLLVRIVSMLIRMATRSAGTGTLSGTGAGTGTGTTENEQRISDPGDSLSLGRPSG